MTTPDVSDDLPSPDEAADEPPDPSGAATSGLDLSPRPRPAAPRRRRWPAVAVVVGLVAAGAFVVSRALGDATVFFYNADEAVARQPELGTQRFRLQGTVVPGTTERTAEGVRFDVVFNGVEVEVHHVGDPPDLFQDYIPVVIEGRWESTAPGASFASDRILVKHDDTYDQDNPDRLREAQEGGEISAPPGGGPAGGDGGTAGQGAP